MQLRERLQRVGGIAVYESWNKNRECTVRKKSYFNITSMLFGYIKWGKLLRNAEKCINRTKCLKLLRLWQEIED